MHLRIRQPDDWHIHLRDLSLLEFTVPEVARIFKRAVVMPNLKVPITTWAQGVAYWERIQKVRPQAGFNFEPLMTLYLTDDFSHSEIAKAAKDTRFIGAKLYPAHTTTHSQHGVTDISKIDLALRAMEDCNFPLLIHGETTSGDVFDREEAFLWHTLEPLLHKYQGLKVTLEHITTEKAVTFVQDRKGRLGATITPHHLHINRSHLFEGGLRPHLYCLPLPKRERDRLALRRAATSGEPWFFAGTDSAPHLKAQKECDHGCAGIYSSSFALELYAQVFQEEGALHHLENFVSTFGAQFYNRQLNEGTVELEQTDLHIPELISLPSGSLVPFRAGETLPWTARLIS